VNIFLNQNDYFIWARPGFLFRSSKVTSGERRITTSNSEIELYLQMVETVL